MRSNSAWRRGINALVALVLGAFALPLAAAPETIEVSLRISGTLDASKRLSGNYRMAVEDWTTHSEFSQSSVFTMVREDSGRIGAAPSFMFGLMGGQIYQPVMSPMDVVENRFTGELKVSGCVNRTDPLTLEMPALPAGVTLPPGVTMPAQLPSIERGTFYFEACAANGRVLVFYLPPPGVQKVPGAGPIKCGTYSYRRPETTDVQYQAHLLEEKYVAALKAACPAHGRRNSRWMAFLGAIDWKDLASGETISLGKYFEASKGSRAAQAPYYDHKLKLALEMKAGDDIRAEPGGPYSPERGANVTLDGSRSRPSKGRTIQTYKWKLTPAGCPDIGKVTEMTGARVTFTALCAVTAELTVEDGAKSDTRAANVSVKERPWKSVLTTNPVIDLKNYGFEPGNFTFGFNRCERHPDPNENHYYHSRTGSAIDYEDGVFWLQQVADGGPFAGAWFVVKGDFTIPRVIFVNAKLYPGGTVFDLNARESEAQKQQVDRLRRSVERHETLHSTLLQGELKRMEDPARAVERGMARDRAALKDKMNSILREAHTRLSEATSEEKVKAEMRKIGEFGPGGRIYYPASGNEPAGYRDFASFADIGDSGR